MAITQLKDGRWICYYRVKGDDGKSRVKKEYFGRGAGAEALARKRDDELGLQKRRPPRDKIGPAFGDLAQGYIESKKNFNENSQALLIIRLHANLFPVFENRLADSITERDADLYVRKRRLQGVKDSTIAREITDLKAILTWAASRHPPLIPINRIRDYKKPKEDNEIIMPPTSEEIRKILAKASPHLTRAIMLSYYTGLRPGSRELLTLRWQDFNADNYTLLIHSAHKGGPEKRQVPVHKDFLPILTQWQLQDNLQPYIIHYKGNPITTLKTAWRNTLKRAGIKRRLRMYDFRHHFITQALEQGADLKALAQIVGSRPETLMRHYQHVTSALHRKTIAKIPTLSIQNIPKKRPVKKN